MSADNRTVSTDALATLGTIIDEHQKRDAIHLAVIPAIAGLDLSVADDVGIVDGLATTLAPVKLGIVDPFLDGTVRKGERFWLVIYPRVITSLRHVWTHPELPNEGDIVAPSTDKAVSEQWLRDFCDRADCPPYDVVMGAIDGTLSKQDAEYGTSYEYNGEYLHFNGWDAHSSIPLEFWTHAEIVLGRTLRHKPEYFSCSC